MSENQVITPEQLEEYMQGLYAKSKVAQKKFEREFTTNRRVDEVLRAIGMRQNLQPSLPGSMQQKRPG